MNKQMSGMIMRALATASLMGVMVTEGEPRPERMSSTTLSGATILGNGGDWNCSNRKNNS